MKIMLLVVENRDDIRTEYAKFLVRTAWYKRVGAIKFWQGQRRQVWFMRRTMVEEVLADEKYKDITHFLFIDTDCVPELDEFAEKLLAHDLDVVSGYYCTSDGKPCNRKNGTPFLAGEGLYEVDVLSMGFSLWKRKVWEEIQYPMPEPLSKLDADTEFCKLVKAKGYKIFTDFSLRAYHLLVGLF